MAKKSPEDPLTTETLTTETLTATNLAFVYSTINAQISSLNAKNKLATSLSLNDATWTSPDRDTTARFNCFGNCKGSLTPNCFGLQFRFAVSVRSFGLQFRFAVSVRE